MRKCHATLIAMLAVWLFTSITPAQPADRTKVFDITAYGAVADGKSLNTTAITQAIEACSKAGGGIVRVPAGRFLTGPLALASNLELRLEKDATLLISDDRAQYTLRGNSYQNCIVADHCHDVAVTGEGAIDGQGQSWWSEFLKSKNGSGGVESARHRPYLVVLNHCTRVRLEGVTLCNSPSFHLVPHACTNVSIDHVQFRAPATTPNTDGLDPSGWNFTIAHCTFDVGDDCIAIKATGDAPAGQNSCENFDIHDCTFLHGHGLSIGGQTPGGLRHLVVRDCTFDGTDAGIRLKAGRGTGGVVEDLLYENLKMDRVKVPILITSYYPKMPKDPKQDPAQPANRLTPIWRHIRITNLTSKNSPVAGRIIGLPEMPVDDVLFTRVHLESEKGMVIDHARHIRFVDSTIEVQHGEPIETHDAQVTGLVVTADPSE